MIVKQWDIVIADLTGAMYCEQDKQRAVLILQGNKGNEYSPTTIIVPLTSELKRQDFPTHAVIHKSAAPGLLKDSMALCEQVRTIDKRRIRKRIGKVEDKETIKNIIAANRANYGDDII